MRAVPKRIRCKKYAKKENIIGCKKLLPYLFKGEIRELESYLRNIFRALQGLPCEVFFLRYVNRLYRFPRVSDLMTRFSKTIKDNHLQIYKIKIIWN